MNKEDLFGGWCAGGLAIIIGFPLDTLKTNMQNSSGALLSTVTSLIRSRGFLGLYRGVASPLSSAPIFMSVSVSTYAAIASPSSELHVHAIAGAISGLSQSVVNLPFEVAKVRMQINGTKDTLGFLRWMVKTNGLRSLWPLGGGIMNSATLTIGNAIYYSAHEAIQRQLSKRRDGKLTIGDRILCGGMVGILFWCSIYPLDGLKTRLLANPESSIRTELQRIPFKMRYRGLLPTVVRAFLTNAVFMTTFQLLRKEKQ